MLKNELLCNQLFQNQTLVCYNSNNNKKGKREAKNNISCFKFGDFSTDNII